MDKIYISGPILNTKEFEDLFTVAEQGLLACGCQPVNPVKLLRLKNNSKKISSEDFLKETIPVIVKCDGIMMLPDWKDCKEAVVEQYVAKSCGKKFVKVKMLSDYWGC